MDRAVLRAIELGVLHLHITCVFHTEEFQGLARVAGIIDVTVVYAGRRRPMLISCRCSQDSVSRKR